MWVMGVSTCISNSWVPYVCEGQKLLVVAIYTGYIQCHVLQHHIVAMYTIKKTCLQIHQLYFVSCWQSFVWQISGSLYFELRFPITVEVWYGESLHELQFIAVQFIDLCPFSYPCQCCVAFSFYCYVALYTCTWYSGSMRFWSENKLNIPFIFSQSTELTAAPLTGYQKHFAQCGKGGNQLWL